MKIYFIITLIFLSSCGSSVSKTEIPKNTDTESNVDDSLANVKVQQEAENSRRLIDSLTKIPIDWSKVSIHKLPISMIMPKAKTFPMAKYCCSPYCDKNFELSELDVLFSNNTESKALSEFEGNGHPSTHQGYFGLRLPDAGENRVLLFSYHDIDASDYKICTIELQIFNPKNKLIDKKIIRDGMNFECGWDRSFSILENYSLTIDDYYACADLEGGDDFDVKEEKYIYRILNTGKIIEIK